MDVIVLGLRADWTLASYESVIDVTEAHGNQVMRPSCTSTGAPFRSTSEIPPCAEYSRIGFVPLATRAIENGRTYRFK